MKITYVNDSWSAKKATVDLVTPAELRNYVSDEVMSSVKRKANAKDVEELEKQLDRVAKHVHDVNKWHDDLAKEVLGKEYDKKSGIAYDLVCFMDEVGRAKNDLSSRIDELHRAVQASMEQASGLEHRLRSVIEDGSWRESFKKEVGKIVNSIDEKYGAVQKSIAEGRESIQQGIADLRMIEKKVEDVVAQHKGDVSHIIKQECMELCNVRGALEDLSQTAKAIQQGLLADLERGEKSMKEMTARCAEDVALKIKTEYHRLSRAKEELEVQMKGAELLRQGLRQAYECDTIWKRIRWLLFGLNEPRAQEGKLL